MTGSVGPSKKHERKKRGREMKEIFHGSSAAPDVNREIGGSGAGEEHQ